MSTYNKYNSYVQPYNFSCSNTRGFIPYSKGYISVLSNTKFLYPGSLAYSIHKVNPNFQFPGSDECKCEKLCAPSLGIYGPISNPIGYPGRENCKSCNKK